MNIAGNWEMTILEAAPSATELTNLAVADVDGDGVQEMIMGGAGTLMWLRPATLERGVIAEGVFAVGLSVEDVDGDGRLELVASSSDWKDLAIFWLKSKGGMEGPWVRYDIDPNCKGGAHDLVFTDIDGDGERELIAAPVGPSPSCAIYIYKRNADVTQPWRQHLVSSGAPLEGTSVGDVDGDGRMEILCGPDLFYMPQAGPYAGPWTCTGVAPSFRDMCRTALIDISGNGLPDAVVSESEHMEGKISWFENRPTDNGKEQWTEHEIDHGLVYAHSLKVWRDGDSGAVHIFVAEMAQGGWRAPYNYDARLLEYISRNHGKTWERSILFRGQGTHEATICDIDNDGELEILGKVWGKALKAPKVQLWKRTAKASPLLNYRHEFIDRSKSNKSTHILAASVDGTGRRDVFCGSNRYQGADWNRTEIPGISQIIAACDIDHDGIEELIGVKSGSPEQIKKMHLNNDLIWLKLIGDQWKEYPIGKGSGDWPYGALVAQVLPDGKRAFIASYNSANGPEGPNFPELFEIPDDPAAAPWPKRMLAAIPYGREILSCDLTGNGALDLVAGCWWLENKGNGQFEPRQFAKDFAPAGVAICDIDGDGFPDIVLGEDALDHTTKNCPHSRLAWFKNPGNGCGEWTMHVIDKVRGPHSISAADLDGDGELEIICGEHDPFSPELRSRCRLYAYKKADPLGRSWKRFTMDDRFEHFNGARVCELETGRPAILSQGWTDWRYVHIWQK